MIATPIPSVHTGTALGIIKELDGRIVSSLLQLTALVLTGYSPFSKFDSKFQVSFQVQKKLISVQYPHPHYFDCCYDFLQRV